MAFSDFLQTINSGFNDFQKWATLQAWAWKCCQNANITIPSVSTNTLLGPIVSGDSELQKFQKVQAMLTVLANGLVGSASDLIQKASTALVQGTQSYPLTFPVQFPTIPTFVAASMNPRSNSGEVFIATVLANSITNTGCTVILSGIPSAASVGGTVSVLAAQ